jgi:spore maturation protein SpmB
VLGADFGPPELHHVAKAMRVVVTVSVMGLAAAILIRRWTIRT